MTIKIGSARSDEHGKLSGGTAGDQNGKEVSTQDFYMHSKGWYILRPKSVAHANAIANAMVQACDNNNIGYDQNQRLGIITMLRKYGTIKNIKERTEADCSSTVRACVIQATGKDPGNFTTDTEVTKLLATNLFEKKDCKSDKDVYNGDILVTKTKGHTVVVVAGRPRPSVVTYYKKYTGVSLKIDTVFKAIGAPYGNVSKRKPIAAKNGYSNYSGTLTQNLKLISLAKQGKLKK